jgi:hypothetical protein
MGGLRRLSRLELVVMTLLQAALNGDVVEVRRLVATGVNVDERDANGATALLLAAEHGKVEVMRALVQLGADKEAKDDDGDTPLLMAAYNGQVEAIKVLAQLGVNKEAKDAHGETALHLALSRAALRRRGWGHTASVCTYAMYLASSYAPQARGGQAVSSAVTAPVLFGAQRPAAHRRARTPQDAGLRSP